MRINPAFLLMLLAILAFAPSIQEWATQGGTAWYRPYQLWLAVVIFVWWTIFRGQKRRREDVSQREARERR